MSDKRMVPETDADWAHWKAASEYDQLSELCPFCPCLIGDIWDRGWSASSRDRNLVFHNRRSDLMNKAEIGSLCLFCQHLDPGNLFGRFRRDSIVQWRNVAIDLGTLAELEAREHCAFCNIVMCTIQAHTAVYRTKEKPIPKNRTIWISFDRYQINSINLRFDKGSETYVDVKEVSPENPGSVPEVNSVVGTSIPWKRIRQWINSCSTEHTLCLPTAITPSGMRLIDVRDRRVTSELDPGTRHEFVALSYVWGKNIDARRCVLLKENTTHLEQTKSLQCLPKTIEDAMSICESLGQRFLWVDRLCIVQDDEAKKGHQIHAMADIFQSAVLTIIATCGDSMESPIPGISTERQTFQSQTHIAGLQMTSALPRLSRTLSGASWSQRGWTYQESILSSRKLYFTDLEVWFTCSTGFQREDISLDKSELREMREKDILMTQLYRWYGVWGPEHRADAMSDYWRHLEEYTKKSLTYQSDIYNAFTGILTALFGENETVYGLPKLYLEKALLWTLGGDTSTWKIRGGTPVESHLLYPSWSWSSIDGAVKNEETTNLIGYLASLVLWSLVNEDGNLETFDIESEGNSHFQESLMVSWREGCFEAPFPSDLQEKLDCNRYNPYSVALEKRWPTQEEFWNEVRSQGSSDTQVPLTIFNHLRPGMLLTRTQTVVTRLRPCRRSLDFEYFEVLSEQGDIVGAIEANELRLKSNAEGKQILKTDIYELMGLSLSEAPSEFQSHGVWNDKRDFLDREGHLVLRSVAVKVLLISWEKNAPIARRVSIGWVYLKAWTKLERTWKTIALE